MPTYNPYGSGNLLQGGNCCQNPMSQFILLRNFFQNMADGLKNTTETLIEVLNKKTVPRTYHGPPPILSVEMSLPPIEFDISYIIYIQRHGPPPEGEFDPVLLERIRQEIRDAEAAAAVTV